MTSNTPPNCSESALVRDLMIVNPLAHDAARYQCLLAISQAQLPSDGKSYCCPLWDGWGCWPNYTEAGQTATIHCPTYLRDVDPKAKALRHCNEQGVWWNEEMKKAWSDYRPCVNYSELEVDKLAIYTYIFGYAVSMLTLSAALLVFVLLRIKSERVTIHKHLFISYVLSGFAWIGYYCGAVLRADVLADNPVWCQLLHILTQYLVTSNFFWMFCEGFVLHTKIVAPFFIPIRRLLCWCYIIGWGFPFVPACIYATIRAATPANPERTTMCWIHESSMAWIVMIPIICAILANLAFLASIVRVMLTKMKAMNSSDVLQMRKATRAVLVLTPLLGLQYILFPLRLQDVSVGYLREIVLVTSAAVTSFQGFLVAIIFCFANGEVISVARVRWRQREAMSFALDAPQMTLSPTENRLLTSPVNNESLPAETRFLNSLVNEGLFVLEPKENGCTTCDEHLITEKAAANNGLLSHEHKFDNGCDKHS